MLWWTWQAGKGHTNYPEPVTQKNIQNQILYDYDHPDIPG